MNNQDTNSNSPVETVRAIRALAGEVREWLRDKNLSADVATELRTAEQALEVAAARHETEPEAMAEAYTPATRG